MSSMVRCLARNNTRAVRGEASTEKPQVEVDHAEADTALTQSPQAPPKFSHLNLTPMRMQKRTMGLDCVSL